MRIVRTVASLSLMVVSTAGAQSLDQRALPTEVADEVIRVFNASGTRRVDGRLRVEAGEEVARDLAVIGGPLTIAGRVTGRIVAVNATVELVSGGSVNGDILVVGGSVVGRELAEVSGTIRTYSARLAFRRDGELITRRSVDDDADEGLRWWQRQDRWRDRGWGDIRLVSARTYNRVEGLPIQVGPAFGREMDWGRVSVDALGIIRSADRFEWTPANIGHTAKVEVRVGREEGVRLGIRHFDVVDAVEPWQLSDSEVGLASFFLHRDYRDYYNRLGGTVYASAFSGRGADLGISFSQQRWAARDTRDPWTLFRDTDQWRANPQMDDASFHLLGITGRYDSRNDDRSPWSGWLLTAEYELGNGTIRHYGATSSGVRTATEGGRTTYDRLLLDLRRYTRVAPNAQLNVRVAAGGWLSGDDLPLQRRFSLGGPANMPGYDFRRFELRNDPAAVDYLTCGNYGVAGVLNPVGTPGECERFALAQVEFRGDLDLDPFGILDEDRHWRRRGWGRGTQWVVFADAGRGWLVGTPDGGRTFAKSSFPRLSTFRTDVGIGLVLDDLGLYLAKSLSHSGAPVNFFIRLRPRF
ncbi:MAG: BamA/TamA family outer membrane protein [Gemmatimonadaceae bacterium]|nr:BamA/TamA family outer membrane protein [Gemmatimonadaceae bacterium]